ncbi:C-type lectin domain family 4 member E-like [Pleuronectes platessa]|uniref:C-type lectin domain family 4 member E-like n=1 Tax=Pleuronectes platessa TaxID=8262 RepID=UPI00232A59B8|nr:C-type lectin domain family 4 member E-like [Pleuronectes platessa]
MTEFEARIRTLQLFPVSLIPTTPEIVIPPRCNPGQQEHASRCFSITDSISKWKEAREDCQRHGGDLAVVQDMEDQKFLTNFTYQFKQNHLSGQVFHAAWIGLTDEKTENSFVWVNNKALQSSVTFWSKGEPNNFIATWDKEENGQDCVGIVPPDDFGAERWLFNWDDITCVGGRHYVCESKAVVS